MFIATGAAATSKLRRSGIGHRQRSAKVRIPRHACRSYGAWVNGVVIVTINMALLKELDRPPLPKTWVKSRVSWTHSIRFKPFGCSSAALRSS